MPNPKAQSITLSSKQQALLKQIVCRSTNPHSIEQVLSDRAREGTPNFYSTEQVVQIVALACEKPEDSEHRVSHWTAAELAEEAIKRSIVEKISPRSVGRFLKRSDFTTASSSLLVKRQSREPGRI